MSNVILKNVKKTYDNNKTVINNVNLEIKDKEFVVLVGASGCGKSTLLRMIAGLEDISDGEIYIGDKKVNNIPPKDRDIAFVFQSYALYPHMTVKENIAFGLKMRKIDKTTIEKKVQEAAEILDLGEYLDRKPKQLSGGQRQRLTIARAIAAKPEILILDDSFSALDYATDAALRKKIKERVKDTTVVIVSQRASSVMNADLIIALDDGEAVGIGTHDELLSSCDVYREIYESQFGGANNG